VIVRKQDEQLQNGLLNTIQSIRGQAMLIGDELGEQAKYRITWILELELLVSWIT